jgi:hypothetical protein
MKRRAVLEILIFGIRLREMPGESKEHEQNKPISAPICQKRQFRIQPDLILVQKMVNFSSLFLNDACFWQ